MGEWSRPGRRGVCRLVGTPQRRTGTEWRRKRTAGSGSGSRQQARREEALPLHSTPLHFDTAYSGRPLPAPYRLRGVYAELFESRTRVERAAPPLVGARAPSVLQCGVRNRSKKWPWHWTWQWEELGTIYIRACMGQGVHGWVHTAARASVRV